MNRWFKLMVLLLAALPSSPLFACKCAASPPPDLKSLRAWAEWKAKDLPVIFQGKVEQIELKGWPPEPVPGKTWVMHPHLLVSFNEVQMYRGGQHSSVQVETGLGGGDCGYPFRKGESYLVYASEGARGTLFTTICSGTTLSGEAEAELRFLKNEPPSPEDLVDLRTARQNSPDAATWNKVCGRIGLPSTDSELRVIFFSTRSPSLSAGDEAEPSSDGSFCVQNLDPDTYTVLAFEMEPAHRKFRYLSYYPGALLKSEAGTIELSRTTQRSGLDFQLMREPLYPVGGQIAGVSQSGMEVALFPVKFDYTRLVGQVEVSTNGAFRFEQVPPGDYILFAFVGNDGGTITFLSRGIDLHVGSDIEHLTLPVAALK